MLIPYMPKFSFLKAFWYKLGSYLLLSLGCLFFLESCMLHRLNVQTQYLTRENLASYYVDTPDPLLDNPIVGERLLIQWAIPSREMKELSSLQLYLKVRYRNHQEQEILISIDKKRGYYLYNLTDQDYYDSGGILTYKVEIRQENCVIDSWIHPLWKELITMHSSVISPKIN